MSRSSSRSADVGRRAIGGVIALLYPPCCVHCGAPLPSLGVLCDACEKRLPGWTAPRCRRCGEAVGDPSCDVCLRCGTTERAVDRFCALGPYDGGWGELVRAMKFERETSIGRFLARRLAERIAACGIEGAFDLVTFVPMSRADRRERGFNQAELLARGIARRMRRPVVRTLEKVRRTPPQGRLSAARRRTNLRDAFRPIRYAGERVLLVDDVSTTGSTVEECARALKRAGYRSVVVVTVARA